MNFLKNAHARTIALAGLAMSSSLAMAQEAGGGSVIDTLFDAVDFSGVSAKVVAMGVVIIGIALAFKGPDLVKRVIRKV